MTRTVKLEESESGWWVYISDGNSGKIIGPIDREEALRFVGPSLSEVVKEEKA